MAFRDDRKIFLAQNMDIAKANRAAKEKLTAQKRSQNQDAAIRHEINEFIFKKHALGESRESILKRLKFVFGGPKYAKYRPFFEVWVNSRFENSKLKEKHEARSKDAKEAEGEER